MKEHRSPVTGSPWGTLRRFTDARIALGRAGVSLPTQPQLAFQLAHAQARDAVHLALDSGAMQEALDGLGHGTVVLESAAPDRDTYLQRPDLGRRLSEESRARLIARMPSGSPPSPHAQHGDTPTDRRFDLAIVVTDGLSALAIGNQAVPFLRSLLPRLEVEGRTLAPIALVRHGRVAVADEVGQLMGARIVVILIGERPGLSSPDSMGLYLTWMPRMGLTDAARNCISNVRPAGVPFDEAAAKLHYLLAESWRRSISGVELKDESPSLPRAAAKFDARPFLLPGSGDASR